MAWITRVNTVLLVGNIWMYAEKGYKSSREMGKGAEKYDFFPR